VIGPDEYFPVLIFLVGQKVPDHADHINIAVEMIGFDKRALLLRVAANASQMGKVNSPSIVGFLNLRKP